MICVLFQSDARSVTIIRHPMTRFVSGFFYRAHSPNWDRFNIRAYFSSDPTYPFKFSFDLYLEMPEYHNILVKMFAQDKFPYYNATLKQRDLDLATDRLSRFIVVGINEAYDASVQLLLAEFGVNLREDQIHQPPMMSSTYANDYHEFKNGRLKQDEALRQRIRENNRFDIGLYEWALPRFCTQLKLRSLQTHDTYRICK